MEQVNGTMRDVSADNWSYKWASNVWSSVTKQYENKKCSHHCASIGRNVCYPTHTHTHFMKTTATNNRLCPLGAIFQEKCHLEWWHSKSSRLLHLFPFPFDIISTSGRSSAKWNMWGIEAFGHFSISRTIFHWAEWRKKWSWAGTIKRKKIEWKKKMRDTNLMVWVEANQSNQSFYG